MITQSNIGLNSRNEANIYNEDGFLPIITAPMYSVVNESNYQVFLDNKIQVCLPRRLEEKISQNIHADVWTSYSLEDFISSFIIHHNAKDFIKENPRKVCIDVANGNIPALHDTIRKAKEIHGDNLVIMAGNVGSVEAFLELGRTGVDYIRVGIGGGGGCNTTSNTGVGQFSLEILVRSCDWHKKRHPTMGGNLQLTQQEIDNIKNVKIVADGISSYIKNCEIEYGYNDNGYAAINKLLFTGADLVMVGKLFAQCLESAAEKGFYHKTESGEQLKDLGVVSHNPNPNIIKETFLKQPNNLYVKYSGMSTQEEQKKYKTPVATYQMITIDFKEETYEAMGEPYHNYGNKIKPSEGSVQWIPVRWTLDEWLNGSENQDTYPYLMGWTNSLRSAMSYTGKKSL